jgi:hypothetical protein
MWIGVYEDILDKEGRIAIDFFSYNKELLQKYEKDIIKMPIFADNKCKCHYEGNEFYITFHINKLDFINRLEIILKSILSGFQIIENKHKDK